MSDTSPGLRVSKVRARALEPPSRCARLGDGHERGYHSNTALYSCNGWKGEHLGAERA